MSCPTGTYELNGNCLDSSTNYWVQAATAATTSTPTDSGSNGLPAWVLDIIKNADKIGAGVGAATGKGGATAPPVVITSPPPAAASPAMPQWIWFVVGGVVLLAVFAIMRNK